MNVMELMLELEGHVCRCGKTKQPMKSLCGSCYNSLPKPNQRGLYRPVGKGYEQAYLDAVAFLEANKQIRGKHL